MQHSEESNQKPMIIDHYRCQTLDPESDHYHHQRYFRSDSVRQIPPLIIIHTHIHIIVPLTIMAILIAGISTIDSSIPAYGFHFISPKIINKNAFLLQIQFAFTNNNPQFNQQCLNILMYLCQSFIQMFKSNCLSKCETGTTFNPIFTKYSDNIVQSFQQYKNNNHPFKIRIQTHTNTQNTVENRLEF